MPRQPKNGKPVVLPTNALVASSTRYPGRADRIYQPRQDWQRECYRHYAICGEARFAARFFGNAVSRATLNCATVKANQITDEFEGPAADVLNALFNGKDGQKQMLASIGQHLTIAGECYLVGREVDGVDVWEIISCLEMQVTGSVWTIVYGEQEAPVMLTKEDVVIRIWLPNPAQRIQADSPFRSLLPILGEIEYLTRHVFAQITSRLAGAGILLMPQSMTFPPPPEQDGKTQESTNDADAFMLTLADAMLTPVADPGSPSAMVPIVVTAPDESIDKAKLLTFWSELDENSMNLRSEAIRRFALGMDLPPEQILGMSSSSGTGGGTSNGISHWGAWQIEEATIKLHVEPMLDEIVNALTISYLRPALDDGSLAIVVYNTSALRLRPDRSKESFELYDRGLLKVERLLIENGFSIEDMPDEVEFKRWLLVKVASGSSTPEQVQAALGELGVDLGPLVNEGITNEERPAPSLIEHPVRPKTPAAGVSPLLAASEALVFRALERAGNRMRATAAKPPGVPAYETHCYVRSNGSTEKLLEDAWSCAAQVLAGIADPAVVVPVLDAYVAALMTEQSPHDRARLAEWLNLAAVA